MVCNERALRFDATQSDPDTACTCENESLLTFPHNFHVESPFEARHEVSELQRVGLQLDEEGEVQGLMWSLLVHGTLVSLPNSLGLYVNKSTLSCMSSQGTHPEGRAGGIKDGY